MGTTLSESGEKAKEAGRPEGALAVWGPALGLLVVGSVLRVYRVGEDDLWPDEAFFGYVSGLPLGDVIPLAWQENTPPLGHLLVWFSERLFGPAEVALRLPFLVLGSLLPPVTFLVGRRLLGARVGAFAGAVVALSPIHCSYSQIARVYSVLPLLALLSAASLWFLIDRKRRGDVVWHGLATAAAIWTHQWGVLLLPCAYAVVLLARIPGALGRVARAHAVAAVLCLPLLPALRPNPLQQEIVSSFYDEVWGRGSPALVVPRSLEGLWAGGTYARATTMKLARSAEEVRKEPKGALLEAYALVPAVVWRVIAWGSLLYLLVAGCMKRGDAAIGARGIVGKRMVLITYLALPLGLAWYFSMVATPIYLVGRQDVMVLPFVALLAGMGAAKFRPLVRGAAVTTYALLAFVSLLPFYLVPYKDGNDVAAATLAATVHPGDVVIYTGYRQSPIEYYLRPGTLPAATHVLPRAIGEWRAGIPYRRYLEDPSLIESEAREVASEALRNRGEDGVVYVVTSAWRGVAPLLLELQPRLGKGELVGGPGSFILRFDGKAGGE